MPLTLGPIIWDPVLVVDALTTLSLRSALDDGSIDDNPGELARHFTLRLNVCDTPLGPLDQVVVLNLPIILYADWGQGRQEVIRGTIVRRSYDPLQSDAMDVLCYDPLFWVMKSKDVFQVMGGPSGGPASGPSVQQILTDTLRQYGLVVGLITGPVDTAPFTLFRGSAGQFLTNLLGNSAAKGKGAYLLRAHDGVVDCVLPGYNQPIYNFDDTVCWSAAFEWDRQNLITQVRIENLPDAMVPNHAPDSPPITGVQQTGALIDSQFAPPSIWGTVRELVSPSPGGSLDPNILARNAFLANGFPTQVRKVETWLLPFVRKGDLHFFNVGNIYGYWGIVGVQMRLKAQQMTLALNTAGSVDYAVQFLDPNAGLANTGAPSVTSVGTICQQPYVVGYPFRGTPYSLPGTSINYHRGVDLRIGSGADHGLGKPVSFFQPGTVVANSTDRYGDRFVIVQMTSGLYSFYCHMDSIAPNVQIGAHVDTCDPLGTLGQTGTQGNPHLHFEIRRNINGDPATTPQDAANLIDPTPYYAGSVSSTSTNPGGTPLLPGSTPTP